MKQVVIFRYRQSDQGTLGKVMYGDSTCYSLELPNRGNSRSISRIPAGTYKCSFIRSPKVGLTYVVEKVPNRAGILFHSGNYAGDVLKGYKSDSNGCILLGEKTGTIQGQLAVLLSRPAITKFLTSMEKEPFELHIYEKFLEWESL